MCVKCHIKIKLGLPTDSQYRTNHLHHINDQDSECELRLIWIKVSKLAESRTDRQRDRQRNRQST